MKCIVFNKYASLAEATLWKKMSDKDESEPATQKSPISVRKAKKLLHLSEYLLKQESKNNSKKVIQTKTNAF